MRYLHLALLLFAAWSAVLLAGEPANLVVNGTLDAGEPYPEHWERANGLSSFFVLEEGRGRVVKLDSRLEKEQARAFAMAFTKDHSLVPPAPKILPLNSYATIGAFDGVALDSELIPAIPGQWYMLSADVKGPGAPIVWIKGQFFVRERQFDGYQTRLIAHANSKGWSRTAIAFNPTEKSPKVTHFKVRLFAYWPNGVYFFDNLQVRPINAEELAIFKAAREKSGALRLAIDPANPQGPAMLPVPGAVAALPPDEPPSEPIPAPPPTAVKP
jgi:hypothetical protein